MYLLQNQYQSAGIKTEWDAVIAPYASFSSYSAFTTIETQLIRLQPQWPQEAHAMQSARCASDVETCIATYKPRWTGILLSGSWGLVMEGEGLFHVWRSTLRGNFEMKYRLRAFVVAINLSSLFRICFQFDVSWNSLTKRCLGYIWVSNRVVVQLLPLLRILITIAHLTENLEQCNQLFSFLRKLLVFETIPLILIFSQT